MFSFSPRVLQKSSVTVAKASVILAFRFVISGTGVENTLSLTYRNKKKSRGVLSGDRGGQGVGQSLPIRLFGNVASKKPTNMWTPAWRSTILLENYARLKRKFPTCPRSFLAINVCNQGKNLCSPCILRVQQTRCDFSQFIYFCKTLYIFQTGFPSIIRSTKCTYSVRYLSDHYCHLPLAVQACSR